MAETTQTPGGTPQTHTLSASGADVLTLPEGLSLSEAEFAVDGSDLVLTFPDGSSVTVENYYEQAQPPQLASGSGAHPGPRPGMLSRCQLHRAAVPTHGRLAACARPAPESFAADATWQEPCQPACAGRTAGRRRIYAVGGGTTPPERPLKPRLINQTRG